MTIISISLHPLFFFIAFSLCTQPVVGQNNEIDLRFQLNESIDCQTNIVCYELQMSAPTNSYELGSINLRMFYDSAKIQFQSINCMLEGFYTCNGLLISPVSNDSLWGMDAGRYLQFNISGTGFPGLGDTVYMNEFTSFAEICFLVTDSLALGEAYANSLVWDRVLNSTGGWQSDGIIFQEQTPVPNIQAPLIENPIHHNWQYTADSSGIPVPFDVIQWPCGDLPCNVVTNDQNDGAGSLRFAIDCAQTGDTIVFGQDMLNATIELNSVILIDKNIVIRNVLTPNVVITSTAELLFDVLPGVTLQLENLNLISGVSGEPGLVNNQGTLVLQDIAMDRNPLLPMNIEALIMNAGIIEVFGILDVGN